MRTQKNRFQHALNWIQDNKWIVPVLIFGIGVIALSSFTGAVSTIADSALALYDPDERARRRTAGELRKELYAFYTEYKDHACMEMSFSAFTIQDTNAVNAFKEGYEILGLPDEEIYSDERIYEFAERLFVEYGIPSENPDDLLAEIPFVVASLGRQRRYAIQDLTFDDFDHTIKMQEISRRLYATALINHPQDTAGVYVRGLISKWRHNYEVNASFIDYLDTLEWDIKYLPPRLFFAQDNGIAARFNDIWRRIRVNSPMVSVERKSYYAGKCIREILEDLERVEKGKDLSP